MSRLNQHTCTSLASRQGQDEQVFNEVPYIIIFLPLLYIICRYLSKLLYIVAFLQKPRLSWPRLEAVKYCTLGMPPPSPSPGRARGARQAPGLGVLGVRVEIRRRGVQWKQGGVVYIILQAVLSCNTTLPPSTAPASDCNPLWWKPIYIYIYT